MPTNTPILERKIAILSGRVEALQEVILEMFKMASLQSPDLRGEIEKRLVNIAEDFSNGGFKEEERTVETLLGDFTTRPST